MYKNKIKTSILALLILLAIIQTSMLWLGNTSSLNFLPQKEDFIMKPMRPSNIWLSIGNIYKISSEHTEYNRLVAELSNFLTPNIGAAKVSKITHFDWNEVLNKPGMFFEYKVPVSVDEILGDHIGKEGLTNIDRVFLNMTPIAGAKLEVYFINTLEQVAYRMEVGGEFKDIKKIYDTLNTKDMTANLMKYEASITAQSKLIKGNTFLPLASTYNPLTYTVLTLHKPISENRDEASKEISNLTSSFFNNPLTRNTEILKDGTITLTENMKCIITYGPQGVMKYINLAATTDTSKEKMTRGEGYSLAMSFIEETEAIPNSIKHSTYLKKVIEKSGQYTYCFDMLYDGYKVRLEPQVQKQLGLRSLVEITVKDRQIVAGNWWVMEVKPKADSMVKGNMTTVYRELIDTIYNDLIQEGQAGILLDDLECVYTVSELNADVRMKWAVLIDKKWYYP